MSELTMLAEAQLTNARINLHEAERRVEEMLLDKSMPSDERKAELSEIINRCQWAVDYLFRAQEELKA